MVCRRIVILLLSILIVGPSISAGAQTPAASSIPAEEELTGLQAAVWRSYAPAGGFVGSTVIDVSEATPVASPEAMRRLRSVSVVIREFDSADNAAMAFERISAGAEETMVRVFTVGEQEITSETLPDIGAQATLVRIDHAGEGSEVWMENVIVQRDRQVIFVAADGSVFTTMPRSGDMDRSLPTVEIATAIADDGEPSPEERVFVEGGTSTGGLWGFMLQADDPLLAGMEPVQDVVLYPAPSW